MRGNRSTTATVVRDGRLARVGSRTAPRHASRRALQLVRVLPPPQVLAALDAVIARYPRSSLPRCHRGELKLWLGDVEGARADLSTAISIHPHTRWAYIGLSGCDLLAGDPERALATADRGVEVMGGTYGPAVYAYRGEALRRLGRPEQARADLIRCVELTPGRVAAWIDLALVHAELGDRAAFEAAWERLVRVAPGLLSDAARESEVVLWRDLGSAASTGERARVLEQALSMMRGNRSTTSATYFTREGRLRFVQPGSPGTGPHGRDGADLARARARARALLLD
jgi:tetratricopeptide (TPR) repeat protein